MRVSKEDQVQLLAPLLKSAGFKKKATTWRRQHADGIHVVNVQGSQWGPEYYLNLGFYISALGSEPEPTEYRCHVRTRVAEPDREAVPLVAEFEAWFGSNGAVKELCGLLTDKKPPLMLSGVALDYLEQLCESQAMSHISASANSAKHGDA
jgi:hypothetical protein